MPGPPTSPSKQEIPNASEQEAAAIERGLIALDSHGVLRLIDLRNGLNWNDAKTFNHLAWHWATCPKKNHVDAKRALEFAQRAVALEPNNSVFADTLAAAYARNGKLSEAIAEEQKAMDLLDDEMARAGVIMPNELPPDESAELTNESAADREHYRKLKAAWNDYRLRSDYWINRRKTFEGRLEVYRKGFALISPKDYPSPPPDQQ